MGVNSYNISTIVDSNLFKAATPEGVNSYKISTIVD